MNKSVAVRAAGPDDAAAVSGRFHKMIGKLFTDNTASIRLTERCGFSTVGLHRRHGKLDGEWRDVLIVERLLEATHMQEAGSSPQVRAIDHLSGRRATGRRDRANERDVRPPGARRQLGG